MTDGDTQLDDFFQRYRRACPEVNASASFMPTLWDKIESRRGFAFTFERLAKPLMTVLAAVCLLLFVLNITGAGQNTLPSASYTDALAADSSAERTYYAEAIRNDPSGFQAPVELRQSQGH